MNRSNLRSLPTPQTSPAEVALVEAELTAVFDGLLARGERDEESPTYELLEAAVDGTLDPVEAERFTSRLAGDPALQREFDELLALRDQVQRSPATDRFAPRTRLERRWLGFAAAAVLLAALGIEFRQGLHQPDLDSASVAGATQRQVEPVFADSFEGGTTASWSN